MASENLYWIWLSECLGVASRHLMPLIDRFESPFEIYNLAEDEIVMSGCVPENIAHRLADKSLARAYEIMDSCTAGNIGIMAYDDKFYPSALRNIKDPPGVLYYRGSMLDFNQNLCIAVVGTRKMSEYGKRAAYKIGYELGSANVVVVSGMALGIDSVAACGALNAGGKTIAVLGCGVDMTYPREHGKFKKVIESHGVVISEFAPGTGPIGSNFPIRNRIISGISQGTVVVEADDKSGAMITAKTALIQGREVFAVPGNIDESNSKGTNLLIKSGANTVIGAEDVLTNYEMVYGRFINYRGLSFSKETYEFSDKAIEKMGIGARVYENQYRENNSQILKTGGFKPLKKPESIEKKTDAPSTVSKDGKGIDPKMKPKKAPPPKKDNSEALLSQMDERTRHIFEEMPIDRSVKIEELCALGYNVGDVMNSLMTLSMNGLITQLPGSIYIKN